MPYCRTLFVALLALVFAAPALADEVLLANGDRITGHVVSKTAEGKLVVKTDYAGEVSIDWTKVRSLSTSAPVAVILRKAGPPIEATLKAAEGRAVQLVEPSGATRVVPLADLAYLNPKPFETEHGVAYTGHVKLSGSYSRGNVRSDRLHGEAGLKAQAKHHRYSLSGRVERRAENGVDTGTAWLLSGNYDFLLDDGRFAYLRASFEHDKVKDLRLRSTVGGGYGIQLLDTARASLSVRGGLDYVDARRFVAGDESYPALGWGIDATYSPWGPKVTFYHEQEGFLNVNNPKVVTVRTKTGLRVPLFERLNAFTQVNVDWERTPAPGFRSTDTSLLLGIDYTW